MSERQKNNILILDFIVSKELLGPEFKDSEVYKNISELIDQLPQWRFGQIVCNCICGDYREDEISEFTSNLMEKIFKIKYDPFFEESVDTYTRLLKTYRD